MAYPAFFVFVIPGVISATALDFSHLQRIQLLAIYDDAAHRPCWPPPTMSGLSSFFPSKLLSSMNPRDRPVDPLARLRFTLETMPGQRQYIYSAAARSQVLSELYDAFWGAHVSLFLPSTTPVLPPHTMLAEHQARLRFCGAGEDEPTIPGRPCGHIFNKGESCFRCKYVRRVCRFVTS